MQYKGRPKRLRKSEKRILLGMTMFGILGLSLSYSSWANAYEIVHNVSTRAFNFLFASEYEDDFKIMIDYGDRSERLDAFITNTGKTLNVSGMEPVEMDKILSGEADIRIEYRLEAADLEKGLLSVAEESYDLGIIPFTISAEDPYWKICNSNGSWGIGEPETEVPEAVIDLLPKSLGELHGYHTLVSRENGMIKGTITIRQTKPCTSTAPEIDLTSLKLPDELNRQIAANDLESSKLVIMANYNFSIPLILEQSNSKSYR